VPATATLLGTDGGWGGGAKRQKLDELKQDIQVICHDFLHQEGQLLSLLLVENRLSIRGFSPIHFCPGLKKGLIPLGATNQD